MFLLMKTFIFNTRMYSSIKSEGFSGFQRVESDNEFLTKTTVTSPLILLIHFARTIKHQAMFTYSIQCAIIQKD